MITMDPAAARAAYREYQAAVRAERHTTRSHWKAEDVALARGYKQLAKGRSLLNLQTVMQAAGLRDDGFPRLAISRSHFDKVWCRMGYDGDATFGYASEEWRGIDRRRAHRVEVGRQTFTIAPKHRGETRATLVPIIPPDLRPKTKLENFHTLWEVESWTLVPPRDPILLRHLGGALYTVLAVWDLTDLERAILTGRGR